MDNWERRTIKACGWLKRSTRRIERKLVEFFDWAEDPIKGKAPLLGSHPEYLLNPTVNKTKCWLEELGHCFHHYQRGELPEKAQMSFTRMVEVATNFVDSLGMMLKADSLHDSMTAEMDLYQYMTTSGPHAIGTLEHRSNVNRKIADMLSSFEKNSQALYKFVMSVLNDRRERHWRSNAKQLNRIERKLNAVQSVIMHDEVEGEHCWDKVVAPRRKQLLLLRDWMDAPENKEKVGYGLSTGCLQSFVEMAGGYPNDRAMYNFAHRHETEFG